MVYRIVTAIAEQPTLNIEPATAIDQSNFNAGTSRSHIRNKTVIKQCPGASATPPSFAAVNSYDAVFKRVGSFVQNLAPKILYIIVNLRGLILRNWREFELFF